MKALSPIRRAAFVLLASLMAATAWAADAPPPPPKPVPPPTPGVTAELDEAKLPETPGWHLLAPSVKVDGKPMPVEFGLWLPKSYRPGQPPLPVIVHLHNRFAIGGNGADRLEEEGLPALLCRGSLNDNRATGQPPPTRINPNDDVSVIAVVPHCPDGQQFESDPMPRVVEAVVGAVVKAYAADADRVYLTGFSYGGSSTWAVAEQTPLRWAAIAPMDGRRTADPVRTAARLRHVAVWITEGDNDGDFTNDGRLMRDTFDAAGHPNFTYREVAGGNHFSYNLIYVDPAFWGWLLGQRRHHPSADDLAAVRDLARASANSAASYVHPVDVALRPAELPHAPGFHLVNADVHVDGKPVALPVGLFLPADFGVSTTALPVVVSLHNRPATGGTSRDDLTQEGLPMLLANRVTRDPRQTGTGPKDPIDPRVDVPAIVVAPQCPAGHTWDDPTMVGVLDQLIVRVTEAYKADPDRVYLTGWSYGGTMAWTVAAALSDRLAAVAALDGRTPRDPTATVAALRHLAVYQVVGGVDREFAPEAQRMVVALAATQHPNFTSRVVPDGNHYCYALVYTDPTFWSWMLSQRRDPAAAGRIAAVEKAAADRAAVEKALAEKVAAAKAAAAKAAADKAAADKLAAEKAAAAKRSHPPTTKPAVPPKASTTAPGHPTTKPASR